MRVSGSVLPEMDPILHLPNEEARCAFAFTFFFAPVTAALLLEQPNIAGDSYGNGGVRDVALAAGIRFEYGSGSRRYRDTRQKKSPSCQLGRDCKYGTVI